MIKIIHFERQNNPFSFSDLLGGLVSLICIEISETWESDRPYLVVEDLLWVIDEHCVSGRMHEV
jgi:hypothetical protein